MKIYENTLRVWMKLLGFDLIKAPLPTVASFTSRGAHDLNLGQG